MSARPVRTAEHHGLAARLPLEHATAAIESVSAQGELVSLGLYGHPWVMGEYWPMITPCFRVSATDDGGTRHDAVLGSWQVYRGHQGRAEFWFWPPLPADRTGIRVTVSTLWEAASADIACPGDRAAAHRGGQQ